ncbi:MAG TPA: substrate-binding domain-containing protein [Acidimicrobiales bacterium]
MKNTFRARVGVAIATISLISTVAVTAAGASATLNGDLTFSSSDAAASINPAMGGSSFDEPFFNAAIPEFMSAAAKVSGANAPSGMSLYSPVGSSSGKKGAIAGTYAVGASDVPMGTVVNSANLDSSLLTNADAAHTLNSYVQVPVVLGGVGLMYNLPSLKKKFGKFPVVLNSAVLAGVYDGAITKWNNPTICKLNPKIANVKKNKKGRIIRSTCALPNLPIVPVYRADGSGTSFIFMDYLNQTQGANFKNSTTSAEVFPSTTFNQGQVPSNGLGGQKNAGVAGDVEQTVGAVGYVEYSYILLQHTLPSALIVNAKGQRVALNQTSIAADAAAFSATPPSETSAGVVSNFSVVNGKNTGDYPIAGYSWAIVRQDWNGLGTVGGASASLNSEKLVAKFLDWAVQGGSNGGQTVAKEQGYVPLPSYVVSVAQNQVASMKYNGQPLGLS